MLLTDNASLRKKYFLLVHRVEALVSSHGTSIRSLPDNVEQKLPPVKLREVQPHKYDRL